VCSSAIPTPTPTPTPSILLNKSYSKIF